MKPNAAENDHFHAEIAFVYIQFESCVQQLCVWAPANDGGPAVRELLEVAVHAKNRIH